MSGVLDITSEVASGVGAACAGASARSLRARRGAPLGTHDGISFTSAPERTAREIGEALDWETGEVVYSDEKRRLQRWEMQSAARQLLTHKRLTQCYRIPIDEVRVWRRPTSSTYYRGLRVCGMVWACPVCAAKVAERRRAELVQAMTQHQGEGGAVVMMTLTVPHTREEAAFSTTDRLLKAFTAFGGGKKAWKALLPGVVGSVRALEVTHGSANGWHPHLHVLVFLAAEVDLERFTPVLLSQWAKVTKRHGFGDVNEHGLRLDDGSKAAKYASKWGLEDELTKAHIKQGRKGGNRTPWALLADYSAGDTHAGHLFREFFGAFSKRHQLVWSRGLRAKFGLGQEKSDEELAAETVEAADVLVARLSLEDWKVIRKNDLRGTVLELLRTASWEAVDMLLAHYRQGATRGSTGAPQLSRAFPLGTRATATRPTGEDKARNTDEQAATQEAGEAPGAAGQSADGRPGARGDGRVRERGRGPGRNSGAPGSDGEAAPPLLPGGRGPGRLSGSNLNR